MATPEWISKNIAVSKDGIPTVKSGKKIQPWIMTLQFKTKTRDVSGAEVSLKLTAKSGFCQLRCLELESKKPEAKMLKVLEGYDFAEEEESDEPGNESDADSVATVPGDEMGLEGYSMYKTIG